MDGEILSQKARYKKKGKCLSECRINMEFIWNCAECMQEIMIENTGPEDGISSESIVF